MSRFARDGREPLPISSLWFQGAILTYLIGFSILGVLAYVVYQEQPPIPDRVVTQDGKTIFTREDILDGMNVFQRYGIMGPPSCWPEAGRHPPTTRSHVRRLLKN
jgi:nitric oxide reductase subunit B